MVVSEISVVQCSCGRLFGVTRMASAAAYGVLWSDGCGQPATAPSPQETTLLKCPWCERLQWACDAAYVGTFDAFAKYDPQRVASIPAAWRDAPIARPPVDSDFWRAIKQHDLGREREIRLLAWWAGNDRFREGNERAISDEARENMMALRGMLDLGDPYERLLAASLSQELGDFVTAVQLTTAPVPDSLAPLSRAIRTLALAHRNDVVAVEQPRPEPPVSWLQRLLCPWRRSG